MMEVLKASISFFLFLLVLFILHLVLSCYCLILYTVRLQYSSIVSQTAFMYVDIDIQSQIEKKNKIIKKNHLSIHVTY